MNLQQLRSFHLDQLWRDRQQNLLLWFHLSLTPGHSFPGGEFQKLHNSCQQGITPCNASLAQKWVTAIKNPEML